MALDTVNSLSSIIQFIADDQEAVWLDTAVQMPSINMGWREVQRRLQLAASPVMRKTVIIAVPANTTELSVSGTVTSGVDSGVSLLPADFFMPDLLEERPTNAASNIQFAMMDEHRWPGGTMPRESLAVWSWQGGVITFVGATRDIDVRMEYVRFFDAFTAAEDEIPIPFVIDALAWAVLFTVALARGSSDAYRDRCSAMCDRQLELMAAMHVKRDQFRRIHRPSHRVGRF